MGNRKNSNKKDREIFYNGIKLEDNYIELKNDNKIENIEIKL